MRLDDAEAPEQIARILGGSLKEARFRVPVSRPGNMELTGETAPAYELSTQSEEHGAPLLIILWPSLNRVDVRLAKSSWTLKDISSVELYPGVEVLFRREEPPAMLFVSVRGRVALIA